MARNGSGVYTPPAADFPAVPSTLIESTKFNNIITDIGTALTGSIAADGQTTVTANIPMNSKKITGLANGSARTDVPALGQVQDGALNWVDGGGTADAITATYSPVITALVDGQICCVRATAANTTTTPTFAPNGLTARTIVQQGGAALVAGNIKADGHELMLRYDLANTRWELLNPNQISITGNAATVTVADTADASCFVGLFEDAAGSLAAKTDTGLTYNATTGMLTATGLTGPLTGNAATSTLASSVTVVDAAADTTTWPMLATSITGSIAPTTDAGITYDASTNALTTTTFVGALTGAASSNALLAGNVSQAFLVATATNANHAPTYQQLSDAVGARALLAGSASQAFSAAHLEANLGFNAYGDGGFSTTASNHNLVASASSVNHRVYLSGGSANNRLHEWSFGGGALAGRFMTDAYGAPVEWLSVVGGAAAGITSITFGGANGITAVKLTSTVATGTAPLVVSSTTEVANLKAATATLATNVTTNANLTGDVTSVGNAATVVKINGTTMSGLATGILKNTTGTGVPSIAVAGDFPTLNQNTTGSAATLTTPRAIYGNNFDGSAALTQIIASTYGGTGNGFVKFTGPTTAEKTFTLPDANATLLYSGGALGTPSSGDGTNLTGTATALSIGGTAAIATVANQVNSGEVTVTAHATTGDIFAAAANSILWDDAGGAITTTIFPNASKAGMTRDLRLNGASKFTAGANLLIEGIPSGTTITLAAGAEVHVRAITTTQFKMTYSVSGTFTATGTGFTANPTATATYNVANGLAKIYIPRGSLTGTSNATSFTITGLPVSLVPVNHVSMSIILGIDNTTNNVTVSPLITAGASTILLNLITPGSSSVAWTGSGTKTLNGTILVYHII